ncbi:peptidoglycan-recognition protein LF-like [Episyrphus balteatus]|uniref:peptidoglycan-recognition protein LF-like n=1 Tax=Episyrphus balteatus TaxID=286459 RepID=UPI0024853A9E|nr:peptidoglycan-recognition protein LF-like [Episyrphus balteatus]
MIGGAESSEIFECKENVTQNAPCFGLVMVTRHEWLAQPPITPIDKLDLPAENIILTDTKTEECVMKPNCKYLIRTLQDEHNLHNDDIAYNFLISSQGDIYEGRGWLLQSAEDSEKLMKTSYWIGLIGNFTNNNPIPETQVSAVQHFILQAKSSGKLISSPKVLCSENILITNKFTDGFLNTSNKYMQCLNKD